MKHAREAKCRDYRFLSKPVLWRSLIQLITDQARSHAMEEVGEIRNKQQSFEAPHHSADASFCWQKTM